jgi:hypothetical protein
MEGGGGGNVKMYLRDNKYQSKEEKGKVSKHPFRRRRRSSASAALVSPI